MKKFTKFIVGMITIIILIPLIGFGYLLANGVKTAIVNGCIIE